MMEDVIAPPVMTERAEPWRRRFIRMMLYGRNVDRAAKARARIGLTILVFGLLYATVAVRLVLFAAVPDNHGARRMAQDAVATARPDILDRNGQILATDVRAPSLFAEPNHIIDVDEASELLTAQIPDLDANELRERLGAKRRFAWLKREITPKQQREIHHLGLPGIGFLTENKRVYPNGAEISHVIGHVNIDNQGIAGMEKWLDSHGLADLHLAGLASDRAQRPIELALDLRVQHAVRDELIVAANKFKVKAAAGIVLNVNTGEVEAFVSLPDYDPNHPKQANDPLRINRLTTGVFELGSTFKVLTLAMGLDSGKMTLKSTFDARSSLRYGRFHISDYHAQHRVLTVPEIFTYSSNIGTARLALSLGVDYHKWFLKKMGQLDRLRTELPESAEPIVPKHWGELNTVTIAFGHGLSVAPLQALMAVGAVMNGGDLIPPTFLKRSREDALVIAKRVLKPETSEKMRYLMRLNAEIGTAKESNVEGFYIGGKTGTAEKVINGRYSKTRLLTDFMAVLPADKPQYVVFIMLDEPQPIPETHGYATAGWNAGPTAAKIISRIAPLLGMQPRFNLPPADKLILAKSVQ